MYGRIKTRVLIDCKESMQKKPIEQKKLEGTYRVNKKEKSPEKSPDLKLLDISPAPNSVGVPLSLNDPYVIDAWKEHTQLLIRLKSFQIVDVTELEQLYVTLQNLREVQVQLTLVMKKGIVENLELFESLNGAFLRLGNRFSNLAVRYYISPAARSKILLDSLNVEHMTIENQKLSLAAKLIKNKRA